VAVIFEQLQARGLVDFAEASPAISHALARSGRLDPKGRLGRAVADLMHLNAAELALAIQLPEFHGEPLAVSVQAAEFATVLTNSGPFFGHSPLDRPALWDVTLFGSDASKLAWLADTDSVEVIRDRFDSVVSDLAGMYRDVEEPTGYGAPAFLELRATIWRAKIAVLLEEDKLPNAQRRF
jgi:hypothetical protein